MSDITIACLLPVRNGETDLPGYFESARRFVDAIIALDDGSTDGTRALLEAEPLVKCLLTNPVRPDYRGWDDAANRNRLLEAAAELAPTWILSLDADERIPPDDAAALREFVEQVAIPGFAYGFRVYRMWRDLEHYSRSALWVYRLFAYEPGQRFPDRRLHFVPIPTSIPRDRWLRTTIRIQHLAGLTEERRRARFEKYVQADPDNEFQHSYRDLLEPDDDISRWEPRVPGTPFLSVTEDELAAAVADATQPDADEIHDRPVISAITISRDDEKTIARTVASIVNQDCPWPFEVIVVTSGTDRTAEIVREQFPEVTLVELPEPALPGKARNAGLRVARGEFVTFPGSHVVLPQGSLAARVRAHNLGYAMVTGPVLNGTRTWAGWANYFLDHSSVLPGRPSEELREVPVHCSYRREALLTIGGFPEDLRAGEDTVVNTELARRGYTAYRDQDVRFYHVSPCRTPWRLVRHHFTRGRSYGRILLSRHDEQTSWVTIGTLRQRFRIQVSRRIAVISRSVSWWSGDPSLRAKYRQAYPLVVAGAVAAWVGTCYELLRARLKSTLRGGQDSDKTPGRAGAAADEAGARGDGLLPRSRIVACHVHPKPGTIETPDRREVDAAHQFLRRQADAYAQADPRRPVIPAIEVMAAIAQDEPGLDTRHRLRSSARLLDRYVAYTMKHGLELILNLQLGLSTAAEEIDALRPWLCWPHVHLALEPGSLMGDEPAPENASGHLDALEIATAQGLLASLARDHNLPPKLLIVHQTAPGEPAGLEELTDVPGVQLVFEVDASSAPQSTPTVHTAPACGESPGYAGVRLASSETPAFTPEQVLSLAPAPDVVSFRFNRSTAGSC